MMETQAPVSYNPGTLTLPGNTHGTEGRGRAGSEGAKREETVAAQK